MIRHDSIRLGFKLAPKTEAPVYLQDHTRVLDFEVLGPFVRNHCGQIVGVHQNHAYLSDDEGQNWQACPIFDSEAFSFDDSRSLICLSSGVMILSFCNTANRHFNWRRKTNRPTHNTFLYHWVTRSFDGGRTWEAPQKVQQGYAAAMTTMIELGSGEVVMSAQNLDYQNGRHYALSFVSKDEGESWQASNRIDIGGQGHHAGCYEGTLVELKDGRVWYCIRTNLDWFWHAFSNDGGRSWIHMEPGLPASSSPAMLTRLHSGRLMLTYNALYKQGETQAPRRSGLFSEVAASWQREELSVRFSDNDGESWSQPVVVAACKGAWLSYPLVFEVEPGRIWLTTLQSELKIELLEQDLIGSE
ncbi:sialidase family protein [Thiomicrorhabdus chilensis]|uniref:sialidase family protein n=1 Tax=Thiomicrorhabdus chilensis TaxID=63656 RepID=UPI0004297ACE|nr:sialidase family protein [Thiomicrorhabdus chilensis]